MIQTIKKSTRKTLETLLTQVLLFAVILSSIAFLLPNNEPAGDVLGTSTEIKFPRLGADSLADPYYYEEAGLTRKTLLSITDSGPERVETLSTPSTSFFIEGSSGNDLDGVIFKVKKEDGSYSPLLKVEPTDAFFGDTPLPEDAITTSELYLFDQKVTEIEFYYSQGKNFSVHSSSQEEEANKSVLGVQEFASTPAEVEYKEKLFNKMGFNLITREEWGAPTSSTWAPTYVDVNRIVVHHTATSVDMANPKNTVKAIYNYHYYRCANNIGSYNPDNPDCDEISELWQDIGYNYLIDPYGNIYEGRAGGNAVIGAHAIPNTGSIGISLLGNYVSQEPTQAMLEALTNLIANITDVNDFDPIWHAGDPTSTTGMYAHRDLAATACPGDKVYVKLSLISSLARGRKGGRSALRNARDTSRELTTDREYLEINNNAQMVLDVSGISADMKAKLLTESRGVKSSTEIGNNIVIYEADKGTMNQLIAETLLVAENSKIQPNFIYEPTGWDNTDPDRAVPDDYAVDTHWNYEKTKLPEAWKDLGGCASDSLCGGDPSIVVAVLDTGVAYENYSYDTGTDSSYTNKNFSGLYIEYPTNDTLDGTYVNSEYKGYEREYSQAGELSGVNFVNPYDAAQDYFCDLRNTDSDPSTHCNSAEQTKIDHANDDHGHGTFIAAQIAGSTGDVAPDEVVGIAHNTSIMPVKVFYPNDLSMCQTYEGIAGSCTIYNDLRTMGNSYVIAEGIDYAVANDADVLNLSFRGIGTDPFMEASVAAAISAGVTVVASTGNDNIDIANVYPANYDGIIAVGSIDEDNERSSYSNYGDQIDLVAPVGTSGSKAASQTYICYPSKNACSDDTDETMFQSFTLDSSPELSTGTSFAAPQVSAAAALMLSKDSTLNPLQMYNLLTGTATTLGGGFNENTGYGNLNIEAAGILLDAIDSGTNPNTNPTSTGDESTDIIAFHRSTTQIDVTPSTGANFGGGYKGYQVWNAKTFFGSDWRLLKSADVNGDGRLDLIAFNPTTTQINVMPSNGSKYGGGYAGSQVWNSKSSYSTKDWVLLDPADVNDDGMADIIAFSPSTTQIDVTLSDGLSFGGGYKGYQVWNSKSAYSTSDWTLLSPADVNGDDMADIIAFSPSTTQIDVTLSTGTNFGGGSKGYQVWNTRSSYSPSGWTLLDPADVNGDGNADIIAFHRATTQIDVTPSTGTDFGGGYKGYQVWNSRSSYSLSDWTLLDPADVNGDGDADIIAFHRTTTQIDVTLSTGTNFGGGYKGYQVWNSRSSYSTNDWTLLN